MVQNGDYRMAMPNSSWATIQKILKAYNACRNREKPTVADIAELAGIHRPNVSSNNNFLRELHLLEEGTNKLSELGTRLATGLELGNQTMVTEALQEAAQESEGVSYLVDMLRARGTVTREAFTGYVVMKAKLGSDSPALGYVGALIDVLVAGNLVTQDGSNLVFMGYGHAKKPDIEFGGGTSRQNRGEEDPPPPPPPPLPDSGGISIPLGINRRAHLTLPEGWKSKELPKLLRMIELALTEDSEQE